MVKHMYRDGVGGSRLASFNAHQLPVVKATPDSVTGYGTVVEDYDRANIEIVTWPAQGRRPIDPGTGNRGGIVEGVYEVWWKGEVMYGRNNAVKDEYLFGWCRDPNLASEHVKEAQPAELLFWHANYHPDGGQIFFPIERKPFVVPLALPGDEIKPDDFVAFYFDGSFGVHVDPGVWHEAPFPLAGKMSFKDKQGAVHARVSCDFVKEFGVYCQIPLQMMASDG
jgi:ureidoglycolate lyase